MNTSKLLYKKGLSLLVLLGLIINTLLSPVFIYANDTTPPILVLIGNNPMTVSFGSGFIDPGADWSDDIDGTGSIIASSGTVDTGMIGAYILEYIYTDLAGNPSNIVTRAVNVIDITPPMISLSGADPLDIGVGSVFVDPGATCVDDVDTSCTVSSTGNVDTANTGSYTVLYDATDAAGNIATTVARTVNVVESGTGDTLPPTVTLIGSPNITLEAQSGSYTESGAEWSDATDGTGSLLTASGTEGQPGSFTLSGSVNLAVPGIYSLVYTKIDLAGNTHTATRTVTVQDTTPPVLTLSGTNPVNLIINSAFTDDGASWSDEVDGSGFLTGATTGSVTPTLTGTYILTYSYTDTAGNTGSTTRTVNVLDTPDTLPPTVTLIGSPNITLEAQSGSYTESGAEWSDATDGTGSLLTASGTEGQPGSFTLSGSVNLAVPGIYSLVYTKIDLAGNTHTATRTVTVQDTTPPVLTLSGTNPVNLIINSAFTDDGASWSDEVDGSGFLTGATTGSVTPTLTGTYILTYSYTDTAGNTGSTTRTVNVLDTPDTLPPTVTLIGSPNITLEAQSGSYTESGAEWSDATDGTGSLLTASGTEGQPGSFTLSGSVNLAVPGIYSLVYTKIDLAGNTHTATRTVTVQDTTPPVLTLSGTNPVNLIINSAFTDDGASWSDEVDGSGFLTGATTGSVTPTLTGTYILTYSYTDTAGNTGSTTRTVNVLDTPDTLPPTVTLIGSPNITLEAQSGSYTESGAEWSDATDGTGSLLTASGTEGQPGSFTLSGSVNLAVPGIYSLVYTKIDLAGNTHTATRTVTVQDTTPPVLTLSGTNPVNLIINSAFTDDGASWSDEVDGSGFLTGATTGSVTPTLTGTYILTYSYTDTAGNTGSTTRTVNVLDTPDTLPPTVTLIGSPNITLEAQSGSYTESGAEWSDATDGTGSLLTASGTEGQPGSFTLSGSVNLAVPGIYSLVYTKIDLAGNTHTATRTVTVQDTTPPVLTLSGTNPVNLIINSAFTDDGASWSDEVDGSGFLTGATTGSVTPTLTGTYILTYSYTDTAGNTGSTTRTVNVLDTPDTLPPTVTLIGSPNITLEAQSGSYTESGAEWSDATDGTGSLLTASGTEGQPGSFTLSGSVNLAVPGIYSLVYTKIDLAGNTHTATRTVTVQDTTPPVLTLSGTNPVNLIINSAFTDDGASWSDEVDGSGFLTGATTGSVTPTLTGTYILTYSYTDTAGNTGSTTRTVNVLDTPDTLPPTVTLIGSPNITLYQGNLFTDSGASWIDNVDGSGTILASSGSVNTALLGIYTLEYRRTDMAGNVSLPMFRTIQIIAPIVTPSIIGGPGGGGGQNSYSPYTVPLASFLFPQFITLNQSGSQIDTNNKQETGVTIIKNIPRVRTLLMKQGYAQIQSAIHVPVRATKSLGSGKILTQVKNDERVYVRYIDVNGWALITVSNGIWGFIRSNLLR